MILGDYETEFTADGDDKSEIKLNGRPGFFVHANEKLDVKFTHVLAAIGGNLGLFVGLSILDFVKAIIPSSFN